MFGAWFGGLLAQNRINAGWTVNKTRKTVISLGGLIMLVSLLMTTQAATPLVAVLLMAAILFGFQTAVGNIQTLPSDFYDGKSVASLAGLAGTAAKLAGGGAEFPLPGLSGPTVIHRVSGGLAPGSGPFFTRIRPGVRLLGPGISTQSQTQKLGLKAFTL